MPDYAGMGSPKLGPCDCILNHVFTLLVCNCPKEEPKREVEPASGGSSKEEFQELASKPVIFVLGVLHLLLGMKT